MNRLEQAKQDTFIKIGKFRVNNSLALSPLADLLLDFDDLGICSDEIQRLSVLQDTDQSGIAVVKGTDKQTFIDSIIRNCGPACAYYYKKGDMISYNKIFFPEYILKNFKSSELKNAADIVHAVCTPDVLLLAGRGVTVLTLGAMITYKETYSDIATEPAENISTHTTITKAIKAQFVIGSKIVKYLLDNGMIAVKFINETVYNDYKALSHTVRIGVRSHHAPSVKTGFIYLKLIDINTGEPIVGVELKVIGFPDNYTTDEFGMVEIEAPIGLQEIKIISFEYQTLQISATFTEEDQTITQQLTQITQQITPITIA